MPLPPRRPRKPHFRLDREAELDEEGQPIRPPPPRMGSARFLLLATLIAGLGTVGSWYYERWQTEYATAADPDNDAQVARGRSLYYAHCAYCHGDRGEGLQGRGGADAPALAAGSRAAGYPDRAWIDIIASGAGPMPGFDNRLTPPDILSVIAFLRRLGRE